MATTKLDAVIAAAGNANSQAIGHVLRELCLRSERVAELIEQDMDVPELGLQQCSQALHAYAKKHQTRGCWACPIIEITPENEAVKVILDFYKIPEDWLIAKTENAPGCADGDQSVNLLDLL